jgi:hypothetical protein
MWTYNQATIYGSKASPQPGDHVIVELRENSSPGSPQYEHLIYTFDGTKNKAQFVAMVRQEIKAYLLQLNATQAAEDITEELRPEA